jgi:hypothetical protein
MSADGELYVGEDCRDTFAEELDKVFGKEKWNLDVRPFMDIWDMETFPVTAVVDVLEDDSDFRIGQVVITSRPSIESGMESRYTELTPVGIAIYKKLNGKLQKVYDDEIAYFKQLIIDFNTKEIDENIAKNAIKDLKFPWIKDVRVE